MRKLRRRSWPTIFDFMCHWSAGWSGPRLRRCIQIFLYTCRQLHRIFTAQVANIPKCIYTQVQILVLEHLYLLATVTYLHIQQLWSNIIVHLESCLWWRMYEFFSRGFSTNSWGEYMTLYRPMVTSKLLTLSGCCLLPSSYSVTLSVLLTVNHTVS